MNPQPNKFIPALYGGVITALISSIPFIGLINCLCCAWVLLGGFLSVLFYKNSFSPDTPLVAGDCMVVGLLSGLIGATLGSFLSLLFLALFGHLNDEFLLAILEHIPQIPPDKMREIQDSMAEDPTVKSFIIDFVKALVLYCIFGLLGGLIGYSVFKPRVVTPMPPPARPNTAQ